MVIGFRSLLTFKINWVINLLVVNSHHIHFKKYFKIKIHPFKIKVVFMVIILINY